MIRATEIEWLIVLLDWYSFICFWYARSWLYDATKELNFFPFFGSCQRCLLEERICSSYINSCIKIKIIINLNGLSLEWSYLGKQRFATTSAPIYLTAELNAIPIPHYSCLLSVQVASKSIGHGSLLCCEKRKKHCWPQGKWNLIGV